MATTTDEQEDAWAIVEREFACDHAATEKRRRVLSNGRVRLERQCPRCGANQGAAKASSLDMLQAHLLAEYDETLSARWWDRKSQRRQQITQERRQVETWQRQQESAEWWAWYDGYLRSAAWQRRRGLVLRRAAHVCEGCGERPATAAHHVTYAHVGQEFLWELRAVCAACHDRWHGKGGSTARAGASASDEALEQAEDVLQSWQETQERRMQEHRRGAPSPAVQRGQS